LKLLLQAGAKSGKTNNLGTTPLMVAANQGSWENIKLLMKAGMNIRARSTNHFRTALHYAVIKGRVEAVELLLGAKAEIEAEDFKGLRPLCLAVHNRRNDVVRLLLSRGAKLNQVDDMGQIPLDVARQNGDDEIVRMLTNAGARGKDRKAGAKLHAMLYKEDYQAVGKLINPKTNLHYRNSARESVLAVAAFKGRAGIVEALLASGARPNAINIPGKQPLVAAASRKHDKVVRILLDAGADPDSTDASETPLLCRAADNSNLKLAKMLLKAGANADPSWDGFWTPLHLAIRTGNYEMIELLLEFGADIEAPWTAGITPLGLAVISGRKDIAALLLSRKANPNACDDLGRTPLANARKNGLGEIARMLVSAGAKQPDAETGKKLLELLAAGKLDECKPLITRRTALEVRNSNDWTPLMIASSAGHTEIVEALLKAGARVNSRADLNGTSALHLAAFRGRLEIVKTLIQAEAEVDIRTQDGSTPMMLAALRGQNLVICALLTAGAKKGLQSMDGTNALSQALTKCSPRAVTALARNNPALDSPDKRGDTPLMRACSLGRTEVVRVLLAAGARVNAKTPGGQTALDMTDAKHKEIIEMLKDAMEDEPTQKTP